MTAFFIGSLIGLILGLIISEYLPADTVVRLGKIKVKNSQNVDIPVNVETAPKTSAAPAPKRKRFLWGVFSRKKAPK